MHIPLEQVQQQHLQLLIDARAAESLWIDYKRDTYGSNDDARLEFLADISSFANTSGGDLVIGINAKDGVPIEFIPFTTWYWAFNHFAAQTFDHEALSTSILQYAISAATAAILCAFLVYLKPA